MIKSALYRFQLPRDSYHDYYMSVVHFDSKEKTLNPNDEVFKVLDNIKNKNLPGATKRLSQCVSILSEDNMSPLDSPGLNRNILNDSNIRFILNKKNENSSHCRLIRVFIDQKDEFGKKMFKTVGVTSKETAENVIEYALKKFSILQGRTIDDFVLHAYTRKKLIPIRNSYIIFYLIKQEFEKGSKKVDFVMKEKTDRDREREERRSKRKSKLKFENENKEKEEESENQNPNKLINTNDVITDINEIITIPKIPTKSIERNFAELSPMSADIVTEDDNFMDGKLTSPTDILSKLNHRLSDSSYRSYSSNQDDNKANNKNLSKPKLVPNVKPLNMNDKRDTESPIFSASSKYTNSEKSSAREEKSNHDLLLSKLDQELKFKEEDKRLSSDTFENINEDIFDHEVITIPNSQPLSQNASKMPQLDELLSSIEEIGLIKFNNEKSSKKIEDKGKDIMGKNEKKKAEEGDKKIEKEDKVVKKEEEYNVQKQESEMSINTMINNFFKSSFFTKMDENLFSVNDESKEKKDNKILPENINETIDEVYIDDIDEQQNDNVTNEEKDINEAPHDDSEKAKENESKDQKKEDNIVTNLTVPTTTSNEGKDIGADATNKMAEGKKYKSILKAPKEYPMSEELKKLDELRLEEANRMSALHHSKVPSLRNRMQPTGRRHPVLERKDREREGKDILDGIEERRRPMSRHVAEGPVPRRSHLPPRRLPPETEEEREMRHSRRPPPRTEEEREMRRSRRPPPRTEEEREMRRSRRPPPPETEEERERRRSRRPPPETEEEREMRRSRRPPPPETEEERERRRSRRPPPETEEERDRRRSRRPPPETEEERERRRFRRIPPPGTEEEREMHRSRRPPPRTEEEREMRRSRRLPPPETEEERDRRRSRKPLSRRDEIEEDDHRRRRERPHREYGEGVGLPNGEFLAGDRIRERRSRIDDKHLDRDQKDNHPALPGLGQPQPQQQPIEGHDLDEEKEVVEPKNGNVIPNHIEGKGFNLNDGDISDASIHSASSRDSDGHHYRHRHRPSPHHHLHNRSGSGSPSRERSSPRDMEKRGELRCSPRLYNRSEEDRNRNLNSPLVDDEERRNRREQIRRSIRNRNDVSSPRDSLKEAHRISSMARPPRINTRSSLKISIPSPGKNTDRKLSTSSDISINTLMDEMKMLMGTSSTITREPSSPFALELNQLDILQKKNEKKQSSKLSGGDNNNDNSQSSSNSLDIWKKAEEKRLSFSITSSSFSNDNISRDIEDLKKELESLSQRKDIISVRRPSVVSQVSTPVSSTFNDTLVKSLLDKLSDTKASKRYSKRSSELLNDIARRSIEEPKEEPKDREAVEQPKEEEPKVQDATDEENNLLLASLQESKEKFESLNKVKIII